MTKILEIIIIITVIIVYKWCHFSTIVLLYHYIIIIVDVLLNVDIGYTIMIIEGLRTRVV